MINSKIKILFIHHAAGWGGAPNSMIKLINSLDKDKFESKVLLLKKSIVSERLEEDKIDYVVAKSFFYRKIYKYFSHVENGYDKKILPLKWLMLTILWFLSREVFANREIRSIECDVIHLNSSVLTDFLKPCSKKAKVVMHIRESVSRGNFGFRYRFFRKQIIQYTSEIIAISYDCAKRIDIPEKTEVVYNYIEEFDSELNTKSYKSKIVIYVGGYSFIKGFETMVNALDYLDIGIKVYFAGYYPSNNNNDLLSIMRKNPRVIEIGVVKDIRVLINNCTLLVSPFVKPHFSRPVIEAFSLKKTVITTNVEGIQEIVKNNYNGVVVDMNNAQMLAEKINCLCNSPRESKRLGEAGYLTYLNKFTPNNIENIESIYLDIGNKV